MKEIRRQCTNDNIGPRFSHWILMLVLLTLPTDVHRYEWRGNYKTAYMIILWVLTPSRLRSVSAFTWIKCSHPEDISSKLLSEMLQQDYPTQYNDTQAHHPGNSWREYPTAYVWACWAKLLVNAVAVEGAATQVHFSVHHSLEILAWSQVWCLTYMLLEQSHAASRPNPVSAHVYM
jgi:hypothetical protein